MLLGNLHNQESHIWYLLSCIYVYYISLNLDGRYPLEGKIGTHYQRYLLSKVLLMVLNEVLLEMAKMA